MLSLSPTRYPLVSSGTQELPCNTQLCNGGETGPPAHHILCWCELTWPLAWVCTRPPEGSWPPSLPMPVGHLIVLSLACLDAYSFVPHGGGVGLLLSEAALCAGPGAGVWNCSWPHAPG